MLKPLFADTRKVLEIGSGTGQHAVHFAEGMPDLIWHTSDQAQYHEGIRLWVAESGLSNLRGPLLLNVSQPDWPELAVDAVFSANTLHIMGWPAVEDFFTGVAALLPPGALLVVYGPFNYAGQYTSEGNARLDDCIKSEFPGGGIKDIEAILDLATSKGFEHLHDHEMPANNRIQVWRKLPG